MLTSFLKGNKKYFRANTDHPLYNDMHNLLLKYIGFDKIIDTVIEKLGDVKRVYVTGAFALGLDDNVIDLVFVGDLNNNYLASLVEKVEKHIPRRIRYIIFTEVEMEKNKWVEQNGNCILLWES